MVSKEKSLHFQHPPKDYININKMKEIKETKINKTPNDLFTQNPNFKMSRKEQFNL